MWLGLVYKVETVSSSMTTSFTSISESEGEYSLGHGIMTLDPACITQVLQGQSDFIKGRNVIPSCESVCTVFLGVGSGVTGGVGGGGNSDACLSVAYVQSFVRSNTTLLDHCKL